MARLNLLYLLGNLQSSKWDNNEIRYSLRSMDSTCGVDWVGIAGPEVPSFFRDVCHIKCEIEEGKKFRNLIAQLLKAMSDERVPEDLILMNDDFFMRATPPWDWVPTHMGPVAEKFWNGWSKSVSQTAEKLREHGIKEPLNYEGHTPMPIKKSLALTTLQIIAPWSAEKPVQFRTAYGNLNQIGGREHGNAKHRTMDKWPEESPFLSVQNTVKDEFKNFIQDTWSKPTRWEADTCSYLK